MLLSGIRMKLPQKPIRGASFAEKGGFSSSQSGKSGNFPASSRHSSGHSRLAVLADDFRYPTAPGKAAGARGPFDPRLRRVVQAQSDFGHGASGNTRGNMRKL
jgi:hypothetical protein